MKNFVNVIARMIMFSAKSVGLEILVFNYLFKEFVYDYEGDKLYKLFDERYGDDCDEEECDEDYPYYTYSYSYELNLDGFLLVRSEYNEWGEYEGAYRITVPLPKETLELLKKWREEGPDLPSFSLSQDD